MISNSVDQSMPLKNKNCDKFSTIKTKKARIIKIIFCKKNSKKFVDLIKKNLVCKKNTQKKVIIISFKNKSRPQIESTIIGISVEWI